MTPRDDHLVDTDWPRDATRSRASAAISAENATDAPATIGDTDGRGPKSTQTA